MPHTPSIEVPIIAAMSADDNIDVKIPFENIPVTPIILLSLKEIYLGINLVTV
jgi:hypothetical protein